MIFKYKVISRCKYQDINLSQWNPIVSYNHKVNVEAPLEQRVEENQQTEKNRGVKRGKNLNEENQRYLEKRSRTDFFV